MDTMIPIIFLFVVFALMLSSYQKSARNKRIEGAYRFEKAPVHGVRKTASREQLKKAGLL